MKIRTTVYADKSIIEEARKRHLNLSAIFEHALADRLGVKVEEGVMPVLIIKVACPKCRAVRTTTTLKRVTCFKCGYVYKVYPKNDVTRIVGIVKGSKALIARRAKLV